MQEAWPLLSVQVRIEGGERDQIGAHAARWREGVGAQLVQLGGAEGDRAVTAEVVRRVRSAAHPVMVGGECIGAHAALDRRHFSVRSSAARSELSELPRLRGGIKALFRSKLFRKFCPESEWSCPEAVNGRCQEACKARKVDGRHVKPAEARPLVAIFTRALLISVTTKDLDNLNSREAASQVTRFTLVHYQRR